MMRTRDGLKRITDVISRKRLQGSKPAAVVVPRQLAVTIVDDMFPPSIVDFMDLAVERGREKYLHLVSQGGYIGTVLGVPMVVADDVVVCALNEQELVDSAARLGVNLTELRADRAIGAA
jgi:hypothetical protein